MIQVAHPCIRRFIDGSLFSPDKKTNKKEWSLQIFLVNVSYLKCEEENAPQSGG